MTETRTTQLDLTNDRADTDLVPKWCPFCGVRLATPALAGYPDAFTVFRAHRRTHLPWGPDVDPEDDPTRGDAHYSGVNGEPEQLGGIWDFRLSFSTEYAIVAAGYDRHDAERRAKQMASNAVAADRYHLHTDVVNSRDVYENDDPGTIPEYLWPEEWGDKPSDASEDGGGDDS